jgi:hypothetical protein
MGHEARLFEPVGSGWVLDIDQRIQRVFVRVKQEQRGMERDTDVRLTGQGIDRVEQGSRAVRQIRMDAVEQVKLVGGPGHEDERFHDIVGLERPQ